MSGVVTVRELKQAERERRRSAVGSLRVLLSDYAKAHDGRFLLFGSAARDTMRHDSDVDILVDFPRDHLDDAWVFAEEAAYALKLTSDIRPKSWCGQALLDHIARDAVVLE